MHAKVKFASIPRRPSSWVPRPRSRAMATTRGKPGNASIIGMKTFTLRIIAGVVTQVRFALSSKQDWNKMDGDFDYEEFFWTIHDLFDDQELADNIIQHWNKVVFGNPKPRTIGPAAVAGPSNLNKIKAARAAQKAATTAAPVS
ncbi:hypothetical protein MVEN_00021900 [Mycena venus]|uniref:Uncharacterized protein n=1 Tax=Mycena venus TaxID=2733690 RepID=A0A8H6Z8D3_9AGAR|nr:hypothetical protein MVEN_00021900 [Mycena venus]